MSFRKTLVLVALTLALPAAAGCGGGSSKPARSVSGIDPANFTSKVDNPWFPLKPGTTYVYVGRDDKGKPTRDVEKVTPRTKVIGGVRSVVVDDRVYTTGRLSERTLDYYAQDKQGRVWYLGEDTAELDSKGKVTTREGTWRTGVNHGRGGIFMPASPRPGESHRQEYLKDHAEDVFAVVRLNASIRTPYRSFSQTLLTRETTRLEPGVVSVKYYAKGIGPVAERTLKGPKEKLDLISLKRG
ncbi:MAG: hypothetical protein ABR581_12165 [Thermoleophilaceae bacterium]